jgi:hypothetical protein
LPVSGTVTFSASSSAASVSLGNVTLDANSGTFAGTITLPSSGTWVLTAAYSGDANVNASQTQEQLTVDGTEATTLTLASNLPATPVGGSVTFTAQVGSAVAQLAPTGSVTFTDGSTSLGAVNLDSFGIGKLTITTLSGGAHSITASYSGDAVFRSSSASVNEMISDYSLQAVTASLTIAGGQSGNASLAVIPKGGFNQAVTFACSGLPAGASCSFSPTSLTPDGTDIASDTMTISASGMAAARPLNTPPTRTAWLSSSAFGLVGAFLLLPMARRKRCIRLSLLGLLALAICSCGGSTSSSHVTPPPVTSNVTVTATTANGPSRTATVSVTIAH